ncbi:glycosyltransferase family 4 protein [Acidipropionibacterium jensenii]|nr:glycosyltransferase [Acidipropionibacterium jensenii]
MNRPFTIASNQGWIGGGEVMLLNIAEAARELGRDVTVVAPASPGDVIAQASRRGFATVSIHGRGTAQYLANLRRWDSTQRRGLLWCNGLRPALATSGHTRRVVHLHQIPAGNQRYLAAAARAGALETVVPSDSMTAAVPGSTVMWNWNAPVPERPGRAPSTPVVLGFIGRLSKRKGILVLLDALRELDRRQPGRFRLLVAGEPRFVPEKEAEAIRTALASLGEMVETRGWMDRDEFFSAVDCAVVPSVWAEPFGLVAAEAMAARCPLVVTSAGALPEITGPGYPYTADPEDPSSLADAIEAAVAADTDQVLTASRDRWERLFAPGPGRERLAAALDRVDPEPHTGPRVVIAHDYLTQRGGAERVAGCLAEAFPKAPILTSLHDPASTFPQFDNRAVATSPLNASHLLRRKFRFGLPLYAWFFEHAPIPRSADVVVASSTGFAHGVHTPPGTRKLVYCHSPARFLYLSDEYLGGHWWRSPAGWALKALRPGLIAWDHRAAASADRYLCNSAVVRDRIKEVYGIDATVIHPPHILDASGPQEPVDQLAEMSPDTGSSSFFLVVSRLMAYKNVDVLLKAFAQMPDRRLVVVGRGPMRSELHAIAPANVTFLEGIPDSQLRWLYGHATAVLAPSKEDYGLTPVEGFSFGTPALALRAGGYLDTVVDSVSGYFFDSATPSDVQQAIEQLQEHPLDRTTILKHAEQFSPEAFKNRIRTEVEALARTPYKSEEQM